MVKYIFKVYDRETNDQLAQVVTSCDHMLDTLKTLNDLGIVKGFILDDNDKENENDN